MKKIPLWHFIYIFQNPLWFGSNKIRVLFVSHDLHGFLADYAKKFAYVELPMPSTESLYLSAAETRKIGKAMLTHHETDCWKDSFQERKQILEDRGINAYSIHLIRIWRLRWVFLYGGEFEIFGTQERHLGTGINGHEGEYYRIIPDTGLQHIQNIRKYSRATFENTPQT